MLKFAHVLAAIAVMQSPILPAAASPLSEPPVFSSLGGQLDLLMVATPVTLTGLTTPGYAPEGWAYQVCRRPSTDNACPAGTAIPYGGVRLALQPGDLLTMRLVNHLPAIDPADLERLVDNPLLKLNPTNLHTHGLIVDATANTAIPPAIPVYGDFIFTSVFNPANGDPAAVDRNAYQQLHAHGDVVKTGVVDYRIKIPYNHPTGAFWFHPHMHGISLNQISAGLSGIISIGNAAAYLCGDDQCRRPVPESQVRHLILKDIQVKSGPNGGIPQFQSDPGFCPPTAVPGEAPRNGSCAADAGAYPDGGRWFFPVNGQQYPEIGIKSADGEIWRLQNASGSATYDLALTDDLTQAPIPVQLLSMDGISINIPTGTKPGDIVRLGGSRFRYVACPRGGAAVCVTELFLMPAARAELWVAPRERDGTVSRIARSSTATLKMKAYSTGPIGDTWPEVNLAKVRFATDGRHRLIDDAVFVQGDAASWLRFDGINRMPRFDLRTAPQPANCTPLPAGHHRRIYFANPGSGQDDLGNPIFGLGYEEIDQNGTPVPNTFSDITRFDPAQTICLPLAPGNVPVNETWELINLTGELHNFHIHQTKFRVISATAPVGSVLASTSNVGTGISEDTIPLPYAQPVAPFGLPDSGSCSVADYKANRCAVTPITVQIPFSRVGSFVFHCHILEHEDGGMMRAIRVVPAAR